MLTIICPLPGSCLFAPHKRSNREDSAGRHQRQTILTYRGGMEPLYEVCRRTWHDAMLSVGEHDYHGRDPTVGRNATRDRERAVKEGMRSVSNRYLG
jgi:hypothetical protein